ncbi:hypothetical protein F2P56_027485 [Juglans regia]|uniref:Membrane-associated kinase regulator 1 n=2 Tax=Juglans regia TaxID=51240 RepID=A0A833U8R0_JUGRE|nr:probable membrane-associated kinase regulator 1 [Juglans regia]KAF5452493.1 hypothetical protein F2P56_027485 [Juglans regia]
MGRRTERNTKSQTLPSSPSHSFSSSSSSSDFEFTISVSPRKSSTNLCPADELFYKGQLLPLHLSPRLSMVRTLLLASSSTSSSSDTTTTASRDSTGSSNDSHSSFNSDLVLVVDCDSSRPSSVTEDEEFNRLHNPTLQSQIHLNHQIKKSKYFSLSRFSSVFRKETKNRDQDNVSTSSVKRMSATAKEVVRKYLKKVKPLYEKLSQKQQLQQQQQKMGGVTTTRLAATVSFSEKAERSTKHTEVSCKGTRKENGGGFSHSFSGNLRYPRRRSCASSCPSSMRSSPSHSGVLSRTGRYMGTGKGGGINQADTSSMEELQSAIQGAIAHCKNSMIQNKSTVVSNEI